MPTAAAYHRLTVRIRWENSSIEYDALKPHYHSWVPMEMTYEERLASNSAIFSPPGFRVLNNKSLGARRLLIYQMIHGISSEPSNGVSSPCVLQQPTANGHGNFDCSRHSNMSRPSVNIAAVDS